MPAKSVKFLERVTQIKKTVKGFCTISVAAVMSLVLVGIFFPNDRVNNFISTITPLMLMLTTSFKTHFEGVSTCFKKGYRVFSE